MFNSSKLVLISAGLYTSIVLLPGLFLDSLVVPQQYLHVAMVGCLLFLAGLTVGLTMFPFGANVALHPDTPAFRNGFSWAVIIQVIVATYVFAAGPTSPLIAGLSMQDAFEMAMLREAAVKLNADPIFVRVYSLSRDVLAPIVLVLGVHMLRFASTGRTKPLAIIGIVVSLALGLWSGQKATVVNYLLAAVIFSATSGWSMMRQFIKFVPLLVLVLLVAFAITLPQLFDDEVGSASDRLLEAILHRVLIGPLDVAAAYIYAADGLRIISPYDVLPLASNLWTPGIGTLENRIGLEFFYSGIESVSANGLAFAYAFVLAGYAGCFFAGILVVAIYKGCVWLVRSSGSKFMYTAFGALLSYHVLDLLNGNYLSYLIQAIEYAILFWLVGSLRRSPSGRRSDPQEVIGPVGQPHTHDHSRAV